MAIQLKRKTTPSFATLRYQGQISQSQRLPDGLWIYCHFVRYFFYIIPSLLIALILLPSAPYLLVRHLPVWTPGATFLRQAAAWKKETDSMYDGAFDWFRRQMVSNKSSRAG